jgi:SAM-dependent methyltransferase
VTGWDFTWLRERVTTSPLPWSFEEIVSSHARESPDLLDMETGGGEWLAALRNRPRRTVATEAWAPNVDLAGERLRALGVTVVWDEGAPDNVDQHPDEQRGRLPFPAESFALISNRHGAFVASEVARVLTRGGIFLTQQLGGSYDDFYDALGLSWPAKSGRVWDRRLAKEQLEAAGLTVIDSAEGEELTSFADVGAFAWYLKAIPWAVEGFSIEAHRAALEVLHARIRATGPITVRQPAFWLKAIKATNEPLWPQRPVARRCGRSARAAPFLAYVVATSAPRHAGGRRFEPGWPTSFVGTEAATTSEAALRGQFPVLVDPELLSASPCVRVAPRSPGGRVARDRGS